MTKEQRDAVIRLTSLIYQLADLGQQHPDIERECRDAIADIHDARAKISTEHK